MLSLAADRPTDAVLIEGLDGYFSTLADNTGWGEVRQWLRLTSEIERAIRSKIIGEAFFSAVVHAAIGVPDEGIEVSDMRTSSACFWVVPGRQSVRAGPSRKLSEIAARLLATNRAGWRSESSHISPPSTAISKPCSPALLRLSPVDARRTANITRQCAPRQDSGV